MRRKREPAAAAATKIVGYCRVSTEDQADKGISLEAQEKKIRNYATTYDLELVAVHVDAGLSGKTLERPGVQDALLDLRKGRAHGLLVVKLDRLTRNVRDLGDLIDTYFAAGKHELIAVNEHIDTRSANGRFMMHILGSISQWERETIAERTRDALAHLRAEGVQLGGTPLGMERLEDVDAEGRRILRPLRAEQVTVKRILILHARGLSLREIAAQLAEDGHQTKRGGRWQAQTIANVIERAKRADLTKESA